VTTDHQGGGAFNADQRDSHPPPFVFLDRDSRPFKAMRWGGEWWLFYWHEGQKSWVSLRPVGGDELRKCRPHALPPEQAKLYDDLHAQFERKNGGAE
jgi:hypothetical protein